MDPVDVLTLAVVAAQAIRSADDPEIMIAGAYERLGRESPSDRDEAMAIRVARLMMEAGERRREVLDYLRDSRRAGPGPRLLNRPYDGWPGDCPVKILPIEPEPEAARLVRLSKEGRLKGLPMLPPGFAPFEIGARRAGGWFDEALVVVSCDDRKECCFDSGFIPEPGAVSELRLDTLPVSVRGLIQYPMAVLVLFTIETGPSPWSLWDICCAFADQYARAYEHPERYGVYGHDLADLWIDALSYCPDEELILPLISS